MFLRSQERKMKNFPDLQMSPYSAHLDRWNQRKVGNASYYKQRESWFIFPELKLMSQKIHLVCLKRSATRIIQCLSIIVSRDSRLLCFKQEAALVNSFADFVDFQL